uniref:Peptidyl-prolyl cis-trans isomerase n=1 Tax=Solanum lycopersicum TaxID=4081 RepID=K4B670_SOLLC
MSVMIVTSLRDITVDLFTDECPLTCKNFLKLCKIKYYHNCIFHTIRKNFTIQTGDPTGTGSAGDSIYKFLYGSQARFFSDEIHPNLKHSQMGTVAMASRTGTSEKNLNASQFYITLRDDLDSLDGEHTVFGEITEGFDTLNRINEAYVDDKGKPYQNIRIKHTYILYDPSQLDDLIPDASPERNLKDEIDDDVRLEDDWMPKDEELGVREEKEEALYIIFSRFGTVTSAEIIRDHKTGNSHCYAFIEFEDKESCEQAYFTMDNTKIDDRRIRVDFSQSVAKLWPQLIDDLETK